MRAPLKAALASWAPSLNIIVIIIIIIIIIIIRVQLQKKLPTSNELNDVEWVR